MSAAYPFRPQGNTSVIAVSTAASAAVQPSTGSVQGLMATITGSLPIYLAIGSSSVVATVPSTSTPGGYPLLPNTKETFSIPPNAYLSAVSSAGTATLMLTPGEGL